MENYLLDLIGAGIILIGMVRGLSKGFIIELTQLAAILIGIVLAIKYADPLAQFLHEKVAFGVAILRIAAFLFLFALIVMIMFMIGRLLTKLLKLMLINWLNQLLGGLFGAIKALLLLCILAVLTHQVNNTVHLIPDKYLEESLLYQNCLTVGQAALEWLSNKPLKELNINQYSSIIG
ncbi:MAG: CvpA family protein [Flavobacteriaceae bacterium]|nr:CvpA family protein [Flavobacteriaceae bacterium]